MYTQVREEESSPLLCGFTAMLFDLMPLAYEDSVKVKIRLVLAKCTYEVLAGVKTARKIVNKNL